MLLYNITYIFPFVHHSAVWEFLIFYKPKSLAKLVYTC